MEKLRSFVLDGLAAIENWSVRQSETFANMILEHEGYDRETLLNIQIYNEFKAKKAHEFYIKVMTAKSEAEIIELAKQFEEETRV